MKDDESPEHLERLRDRPEIKAALLVLHPVHPSTPAWFERSPKNALYRAAIEGIAARWKAAGRVEEASEPIELYGRPCRLLTTLLAPSQEAPFAFAVASADGAPIEPLVTLLRSVSHDYWYGSTFFK